MKSTAKPTDSKRGSLLRFGLYAVFFVIVFSISYLGIVPRSLSYSAGDVALDNIIAPKRIVNERLTENLRLQAENTTAPVYDYIVSAYSSATEKVVGFYSGVYEMHDEYLDEAAVKAANSVYSLELTLEQYSYLVNLSQNELTVMKNASLDALNSIYSTSEVIASHLDVYRMMAEEYISHTSLNPTQKVIASSVVKSYIIPNMILNESATALARKAARDSVYEVVYETGQTIINKGDVLTEDDIQLLKDNNLLRTSFMDMTVSSVGLPALMLLILFLFDRFLRIFHPDISGDAPGLICAGVVYILVLSLGQIGMDTSPFLIPAALFPMCMCMIYSSAPKASFFCLFYVPLLCVCLQFDVDTAVFVLISSAVGIINLRNIRSRSDIITTGFRVAAVNVVMVLVLTLYRSGSVLTAGIFRNTFYAIGNGAACALAVSIICLIWENVFRKLTPFRLLEMSGANDRPIQELITRAPGTYHHSLIVSNLSEAAAISVGGNPLLARVGAYYHDIGKIEKAMYFSENQAGSVNILDNLAPDLSAKIIKNHVTDGMAIATHSKVPSEVVRFIETHHGTSEITYFKIKADREGYAGEENFHYRGALPVSREESIVMLADSVEAAARSLKNPDAESLKNVIDRIFEKKIGEGQLEQSMLTFADIDRVKKEFYEVLLNIYHQRVEYPDAEKENKIDEEN
ncbi:MAG: HDIG domain-containing protein [Eubacteriaceae bacterium]|nr:HDIG domain-containing protein [Eubacteriaceae bacterium]